MVTLSRHELVAADAKGIELAIDNGSHATSTSMTAMTATEEDELLSATQAAATAPTSAPTTTATATDADATPPRSCATKVRAFIKSQRFLLGMVFCVVLAALVPDVGKKHGPLAPQITVKYIVVPIVFLLSGLKLKSGELYKGLKNYKLHTLIQLFCFGYAPFVTYGIAELLRHTSFDSLLIDGLVVLSALPTTISMCNILTLATNADEVTSLFNSTLSNLLGIVVSPSLLMLLLGSTGGGFTTKVLQSLCLTLLLPLTVGQCLRQITRVRTFLTPWFPWFKPVNEVMLLIIVFTTFCQTFSSDIDVSVGSLFVLIAITLSLYCFYLLSARLLFAVPLFHLSRRKQVASMFVATQKTVAVGIPLLNVLYEDNDDAGILVIPLLMFHPGQLIVCSLLKGSLTQWIQRSTHVDDVEFFRQESLGLTDVTERRESLDSTDGAGDGGDDADGGGLLMADMRPLTTENLFLKREVEVM